MAYIDKEEMNVSVSVCAIPCVFIGWSEGLTLARTIGKEVVVFRSMRLVI